METPFDELAQLVGKRIAKRWLSIQPARRVAKTDADRFAPKRADSPVDVAASEFESNPALGGQSGEAETP